VLFPPLFLPSPFLSPYRFIPSREVLKKLRELMDEPFQISKRFRGILSFPFPMFDRKDAVIHGHFLDGG